jgi:uncharacterized protein (TIGR04222 family)
MLTMHGPQFLLLFAIIVVSAYIALGFVIAAREREQWPRSQPLRDPYAIAFLRGGAAELTKVVALALTLRGLLRLGPSNLQAVDPQDVKRLALPVEKAVLQACVTPATPQAILSHPAVELTANIYKRDLQNQKLLADAEVRTVRLRPVLLALLLVCGLGVAKLTVALATGHRNVGFLIILLVIAALVIVKRLLARRTATGDNTLRDLRTLFSSLRRRKRSSSSSELADATMLASVYGVYILPELTAPLWTKLYARQSGSNGTSSCGGSSCGGGGGCGGGGCGGCGS